MPAPRSVYQYAVIRIVPRVEREEYVNAGVILLCRPRRFLAARVHLHIEKVRALAPGVDPEELLPHLAVIERLAAGDPATGPLAALTQAERFHWLSAPASTIIQPGPVHTGLCRDPAMELVRLFGQMVI